MNILQRMSMLTKCKLTFTLKYSHFKKQKMHTEVKSPRSGPSKSIAQLRWRRQACMVGALFVLYREKNCAGAATLNRAAQCSAASYSQLQLVVYSVCTQPLVITQITHGDPGQYSSVPMPVLYNSVSGSTLVYPGQNSSVPRSVL